MKKRDKLKNMEQANLMLENRKKSKEVIEARNKKLLKLHKKSVSINCDHIKKCKEFSSLVQ